MVQEIMPYLVPFFPVLICAICAKRYNFLFGFFTFFSWSYYLSFIILDTPIIQSDFKVACGLDVGAENLSLYVVSPMQKLLSYILTETGLGEINDLLNKNYAYLIAFIVLTVIFQVIASTLRTRRVRELRQLKRR